MIEVIDLSGPIRTRDLAGDVLGLLRQFRRFVSTRSRPTRPTAPELTALLEDVVLHAKSEQVSHRVPDQMLALLAQPSPRRQVRANWDMIRKELQEYLALARALRFAEAKVRAAIDGERSGINGTLRDANLKRGPIGPFLREHNGHRFGAASSGDYDLAPEPSALALLAGRAIEGLPSDVEGFPGGSFLRSSERLDLRSFASQWSSIARTCLARSLESKSGLQRRYAIAGIALAAEAGLLNRGTFRIFGLDDLLENLSRTNLDASLRGAARRVARFRLTPETSELYDVLDVGLDRISEEPRRPRRGRRPDPSSGRNRLAAFLASVEMPLAECEIAEALAQAKIEVELENFSAALSWIVNKSKYDVVRGPRQGDGMMVYGRSQIINALKADRPPA